jgi:tRNA modification GTPase
VRVSGSKAGEIAERCFVADAEVNWQAARFPRATPGTLRFPLADRDAVTLPALLYYWPGQRSYTHEPVAELHLISSAPILQAVVRALCQAGARLAEPGEFTLRAFLTGRMDLTQAEAVLGVIDARSSEQLDTALNQLAGNVARPLAELRNRLLDLLAHLEAGLDFAEEDIEFISKAELRRELGTCAVAVSELADNLNSRTATNSVVRVVLVGLPSVGKSRLFNAVAGQAALVDEAHGTTRDFLLAPLDLDGVQVELVDTAGVADTASTLLEGMSQRQAKEQHTQADLRLFCFDATRSGALTELERQWLAQLDLARDRVVWTKSDLIQTVSRPLIGRGLVVSSVTGEGLSALRADIRSAAMDLSESQGTILASTAERCRAAASAGAEALARATQLVEDSGGEELIAAELRGALHELGLVAGDVHTDDILDRVFSRFCIGK